MGTPTRWVPNPAIPKDYKKQYYRYGRWIDVKKHILYWSRMPYFATSATLRAGGLRGRYNYPYNIQPMRATAQITFRTLWDYIKDSSNMEESDQWKEYGQVILNILRASSDQLAAVIREIGLLVCRYAIEAIPVPAELENFKEILWIFFNYLAEQFSFILFKIDLNRKEK